MTIYWPAGAVPAHVDSVVIEPMKSQVVRNLQSGRVESRRFGSGEPDELSCRMVMTPAQYDALIEWYETETEYGAEKFQASWLEDLGYAAATEARVIKYPTRSHREDHWVVAVKVMVFK